MGNIFFAANQDMYLKNYYEHVHEIFVKAEDVKSKLLAKKIIIGSHVK